MTARFRRWSGAGIMVQFRAENFVSYRAAVDQRGVAAADLEALPILATAEGRPASVLNDLRARRTVLGWSVALEAADDLYDASRYEEALAAYERLSLQLLALIKPQVWYLRKTAHWLEGAEITGVMVEAAAGLLNHILPDQQQAPQVLVKRPNVVDVGKLGGRATSRVTSNAELPDGVTELTVQAAAALEQGDWASASVRYEKALDALSDDRPQARADLLLNLGALAVQQGRAREGLARLSEAQELYMSVGDELGAAEALHNRGLTQLVQGNAEDARTTLGQARKAAGAATLRALLQQEPERRVDGGNEAGREPGGLPRQPGIRSPRLPSRPLTKVGGLSPRAELGPFTVSRPTKVDADVLAEAIGSDDLVLRMRSVTRGGELPVVKLGTPAQERAEAFTRTIAFIENDDQGVVTWSPKEPLQSDVLADVLRKRRIIADLDGVGFQDREVASTAAALPQLYGLTLPIKIGDCLNRLNRFAAAHEQYERASRYSMINTELEAPDLWRRMAENIAAWGDSLYQEEQTELALPVYGLLMTPTFEKADSVLYSGESLAPTGTAVAAWLDAVRADTELPELNPSLQHVLFTVIKRWTYIEAGLDFFGTPANVVTPFSFRYLQDVARYLAQRASQAEQRYVEYYTRYESGQMSRLDLQSTVQQAQLGRELAAYNEQSARRTAQAASAASDLADLRTANARDQLNEFNDVGWELASLAGHIARGSAWTGGDLPNLHYSAGGRYDFDGSKHEVLQELTRRQTEIGNDLQASRMADAIAELDQGRAIAAAQEAAARAREQGAVVESKIARARQQHATEMLDAFNQQRFNPEQWLAMAGLMQSLALSALDQATDVARLMEKAYNFENFDNRDVIRTSYRSTAAGNLLGAELLTADIDSFTSYHVTQVREKPIPVKWGLSLAEEYPGQFLGLQNNGRMEFDVDLSRLALTHPGTYRHRLVAAELEVDGFVPPTGLHGRLTNSGLGRYRNTDGTAALRLQPAETLVLSRYSRRDDALLLSSPQEMRGLFEGNSVASGWTLEIPRANNDVDLHLVFDLRLVLYFDCLFDHTLFDQDSAPPPGITFQRNRALHLAQHAPDAYFQLRESGAAELQLEAADFPFNQRDPMLTSLALGAVGSHNAALAGVKLQVVYPGQQQPLEVTLDAEGRVPSTDLPVPNAVSSLGEFRISLADEHLDRRTDIEDLVLVLGYDFTPA